MMTDKPAQDDYADAVIVYLGDRIGGSGKMASLVITPDRLDWSHKRWTDKISSRLTEGDEVDQAASAFHLAKLPLMVIGGLYQCHVKIADDGQITSIIDGADRANFVRPAGDPLEAVWQAAQRADRVKLGAAKAEEKRAKNGALDRLLIELNGLYLRTAPAQRTAFQLMVINAMQKR